MRIVVAMDSFKGSLTSFDAGHAVDRGIEKAWQHMFRPLPRVKVLPLADGGEGTVTALIQGLGGVYRNIKVRGPLKAQVEAIYGIITSTDGIPTAVIEMAAAAGLWLVPEKERNPLHTTTYGVGELILHAMSKGCRNFLVGIGGSATNDGGIGMLTALGFEFRDDRGREAGVCGKDLEQIASIRTSGKHPALDECSFRIACDVNNPLCGPNGAAAVFGPQKGASPDDVLKLDRGLANLADVASKMASHHKGTRDNRDVPGAGAAGGLGYAFVQFLKGKLEPGAAMIMDAIGLEDAIRDADLVITGEGRMDEQTAMGKAPMGVARLAKKHGKKVIAFCGSIDPSVSHIKEDLFDLCLAVTPPGASLELASEWLQQAVFEHFTSNRAVL
ncbi:MAG: glycerate kinase [Bacteroidales bacterium]|nr:glycerate kinase [Bacteroidales bacterium]